MRSFFKRLFFATGAAVFTVIVLFVVLDILGYSYLYIRRHGAMGYKAYYDTWVTFLPERSGRINVMEGFKKTHFNPTTDPPNRKLVWLFGGSTMEGSGSPETTIPSYLASLCSAQFGDYFFVNFGKSAMVNDQEVRLLLLLLKDYEKRPNLVIFYDGANDVSYDVLYREVSAHYEINRMKSIVEYRAWELPMIKSLYYLWENSYAKRTLLSVYKNFIWIEKHRGLYEDILSASAIGYGKRADLIERIGNEYGFRPVFVLQPFLLDEIDPHLNFERKIWASKPSEFRDLVRYYYDGIREAMNKKNNFVDLSFTLCLRNKPYYKDTCHLTDTGRYQVAKALYLELKSHGYFK